jgi:transcriptional regulator with AAA-type ATPase domain
VDATEPGERDRWGDLERALSDASTDVIVAHVDRLPPTSLRRLSAALQAHLAAGAVPGARSAEATASETNSPKVETAVADRTWVAVTTGTGRTEPDLQKLLNMIPRTVEVPPLRHHAEDVARLVPFLLARLGYGGKVSCSPEVVALMSRATWPGNIAQVLATLRIVVKHCRTGVIGPEDLPPEILTVSRRRLSPLESIERDAIVRGLLDAHDNKAEAARALGMSRATIYRKIHEYGIVSTPSSGRPRQQEPSARTGVNPGRRSRRQ